MNHQIVLAERDAKVLWKMGWGTLRGKGRLH
jgi:hypothetical protein